MTQIVGALILRKKLPDSARPFRMWLYPLPALLALILWFFVLSSPQKGFKITGLLVLAAGSAAFLLRARLARAWPFARNAGPV
jgi:hypothetical protein